MGLKVFLWNPPWTSKNGVEIRPKWDWKAKREQLEKVTLINGWNQTKMGLKEETADKLEQVMKYVEIRPKWDWKDFANCFIASNSLMLKSDQNGIESSNEQSKVFEDW